MDTSYVNTKGQLVIPVRIRRKLGIKPGTKVCFVERGSDILFQPVTKEYIRSMSGMLKSASSVTEGLLYERKGIERTVREGLQNGGLDKYAVLAFLLGEAGQRKRGL